MITDMDTTDEELTESPQSLYFNNPSASTSQERIYLDVQTHNESKSSQKTTLSNNVFSPATSPSCKVDAPVPSISVQLSQEASIASQYSDTEENVVLKQNPGVATQGNVTHIHQTQTVHNIPSSSQESSSSFSPFSSPISSPYSDSPDGRLASSVTFIKQPSSESAGTFLRPGTSKNHGTGDREKCDHHEHSQKIFIHPSAPENVKNGQNGVESNSVQGQSLCATGQRIQSQARLRKSSHINLLKKIMSREISGVVKKNPGNIRDPQVRLFTRLPARLAFCLRDAVPHSAIENGHIFLGFSKCGQFLLSYTQTEADVDLVTLVPHFHYHYRLHWWLFVPYRRAKKVAEVTLFSNSSAAGNLHISFCQWPKDNRKVLVFGYQVGENYDPLLFSQTSAVYSSARPCYITVTAIPSLNACRDCVKVAASYEEDEMAAAWNSCVRLSCLEHGMTVHTSFDLVPPYPIFEPRVSMKRDSWVLINSGNFLHAMHFELEDLKPNEHNACGVNYGAGSGIATEIAPNSRSYAPSYCNIPTNRQHGLTSPQYGHSFSLARWSELRISVSEFTSGTEYPSYGNLHQQYLPLTSHPSISPYHSHSIFSPTHSQYSPSVHAGGGPSSVATDSSDCESECSYTTAHSYSKHTKHKKVPMNPERLERVANFVDQLSPPQYINGNKANSVHKSRLKRVHVYSSVNAQAPACEAEMGNVEFQAGNAIEHKEGNKRKRLANAADKAYELTDDNFDENSVQEKLSTFRKKRLADKKYEFTDEDCENIPLPKLRSQHQQQKGRKFEGSNTCKRSSNIKSMNDTESEETTVLKTLSSNQPLPAASPSEQSCSSGHESR